ncbi:DUF202 domain-containing protein [Candidatus Pacearchaeota archaeon]|nr:DUF202 domain-containing protein [Candidatus Pacearchaeota archaeon]
MEKNSKLKLEKEMTLMSNERTLLSYIRTTFSAIILGFALIQLSKNQKIGAPPRLKRRGLMSKCIRAL